MTMDKVRKPRKRTMAETRGAGFAARRGVPQAFLLFPAREIARGQLLQQFYVRSQLRDNRLPDILRHGRRPACVRINLAGEPSDPQSL